MLIVLKQAWDNVRRAVKKNDWKSTDSETSPSSKTSYRITSPGIISSLNWFESMLTRICRVDTHVLLGQHLLFLE